VGDVRKHVRELVGVGDELEAAAGKLDDIAACLIGETGWLRDGKVVGDVRKHVRALVGVGDDLEAAAGKLDDVAACLVGGARIWEVR